VAAARLSLSIGLGAKIEAAGPKSQGRQPKIRREGAAGWLKMATRPVENLRGGTLGNRGANGVKQL